MTPRVLGERGGRFPGEVEDVRTVCERWGHGNVRELALRLWEEKDPVGGNYKERLRIEAILHPAVRELRLAAAAALRLPGNGRAEIRLQRAIEKLT